MNIDMKMSDTIIDRNNKLNKTKEGGWMDSMMHSYAHGTYFSSRTASKMFRIWNCKQES